MRVVLNSTLKCSNPKKRELLKKITSKFTTKENSRNARKFCQKKIEKAESEKIRLLSVGREGGAPSLYMRKHLKSTRCNTVTEGRSDYEYDFLCSMHW